VAEHDGLLQRFRPVLVYDAQEVYFADHPAQMVVNPGNDLRRRDGTVLARAGDGTLTLDVLGPETYTNGDAVAADDCLAIHGTNYRDQYVALRESPAGQALRNFMVARAKRDSDGRLWLQYWFWYFYNDYRLAADFGLHEGDWEMVQLRLDPAEAQPDYAVFAQHKRAERRPWDQVHKDPHNDDAALVYVARGSHASYFRPGVYATEVWADVCDGARRSPPSALLLLDDDALPGWVTWPGRWGDTRPRNAAEDAAPDGPGRKQQWKDPKSLFADAYQERTPKDALPGPAFDVGRRDGQLIITYDMKRVAGRVTTVIVNVNSRQEPATPPKTYDYPITATSGRIATPIAVQPGHTYDVNLSVDVERDGQRLPSVTVCRSLDPGDHEPARVPTTKAGVLIVSLMQRLGRLGRR
jgi:hypothetical protein